MAKKKPVEESAATPQKKTCFVAMPFGGWLDEYYKTLYIPAIRKAGLQPSRADDYPRPGEIVADIWEGITEADVVLADLSNTNGNVLYEVGIAHAKKTPVVFVVENLADVPSDLLPQRMIIYDKNNPEWPGILKKAITETIREMINSPQNGLPSASLKKRVKPKKEPKPVTKAEEKIRSLEEKVTTRTNVSRIMTSAPASSFASLMGVPQSALQEAQARYDETKAIFRRQFGSVDEALATMTKRNAEIEAALQGLSFGASGTPKPKSGKQKPEAGEG